MINYEALLKISYGLYIVSSGEGDKGNGFVSNAVFQVTSEPAQFAVCCNKENFSHEVITKNGKFSVSILNKDTANQTIAKYGYKSGKTENKFEGSTLKTGETGVPIVMDDAIAYLECTLVNQFEVGTHTIFIGELVTAEVLAKDIDPLTYGYYREVKKGMAPKNAPTYIDKSKLEKKAEPAVVSKKYKCSVCGFIYDEKEEGKAFSDQPDSYTCPVCGAEKEDFTEL